MDNSNWFYIIFSQAAITASIGKLLHISLTSYVNKKSENQAQKEDIGELTTIVKSVESTFNRDFEKFKIDIDYFKSIRLSNFELEKKTLIEYHAIVNTSIFKIFDIDLWDLNKLPIYQINNVINEMKMFKELSNHLSKVRLLIKDESIISKARELNSAALNYQGKVQSKLAVFYIKKEHRDREFEIVRDFLQKGIDQKVIISEMLSFRIIEEELNMLVDNYQKVERLSFYREVQTIDEEFVDMVKKYINVNSVD
ncbi:MULTISPECIES: hypothetical protein [unclassified Sphingobacterium]|uniref:hypothetical protein n=1 Tax=unclassified Sphingobacterium TaxID=2609468 RepID=UPI0025F6398C|nr:MULTISPECIES: hypothetical protein [unclassified Sphingobacterium]